MRFRPPILILLAVVGFAGALAMVVRGNQEVKPMPPVSEPAKAPYANFVAGAGLVEPAGENIAIGTQLSGVVMEVPAKPGDRVKAGDLLFRLDDRAQRAALASARQETRVAQANAASAEGEVERLEAMPRAEEVAPRRAALALAESQLADAKDQLATLAAVNDARAVPRQDIDRKRFAVAGAQEVVSRAKADLELALAGAWAPDLTLARVKARAAAAQVESARAREDAAQVEIERLAVRAPADAEVLRVNVRAGEYAQAFVPQSTTGALMVVGDTRTLHVRVDVDENDAWKVARGGAKARAFARGNSSLAADLSFVRVEPLVIPKRSLTGDSTERVDTRVLQVIFAFDPKDLPVYVGQQMDVYIEAGNPQGASAAPAH